MTSIAIAVVEHEGRFLIGQRPPDAPLAGLWEFPGGKVEPSELPSVAAIRECREETGLEVKVEGEYPPEQHDYEHGRVQLRFFRCVPLSPNAVPIAPFRWVERAGLAKHEFPAGNKGLLAILLER
jgi:mutator protein MutT